MSVVRNGIAVNLEALALLMGQAATITAEAQALMRAGQRNAAIGTVLGLDELLENARALHRAALALHRTKLPRQGGAP